MKFKKFEIKNIKRDVPPNGSAAHYHMYALMDLEDYVNESFESLAEELTKLFADIKKKASSNGKRKRKNKR